MKHTWLLATLLAVAGSAWAAESPWRNGIGLSRLEDPRAAGREAAAEARKAFGEGDAKVVLVAAAQSQLVRGLVEGVAELFPMDIIYGCEVAAPLIPETNFPEAEDLDIPAGVAVLAIGGGVDVTVKVEGTDTGGDAPYLENGRRLGTALLPAVKASNRPGKLIVTFGDQFNGSNKDVATGLQEGLGETFPIVGGAAGNRSAKEIVKGEIVSGVNVAILLAGDFQLGLAMRSGTHSPDTADKAMAAALAEGNGKKPFFAFLFDCRRRRQQMIDQEQLAEEHAVFLKHMEGAPFFGFYGPGEIGAKASGEPAEGVGFTVTTAVLFPVDAD